MPRQRLQRPKPTTQAEVDVLIDRYIDQAIRCEARRDRSVYESVAYWKHHDAAQKWHYRAEALMPASARTIEKDSWK
jgi:hypothetical protein